MPQQISPKDLAARLAAGEKPYLLDVRQQWEHETARLENSVLVPLNELPARHDELKPEPGQVVVTYCHHGVRSLNAAAFLESVGFSKVLSLQGGIDAWSQQVDPTVQRY